MRTVGIRALKQNASAVVAEAAAGEVITITDRGRAVATLAPIVTDALATLINAGLARPARGSLADLPAPPPGPSLTADVLAARDDERY